jgi:hypothetical protein
MAALPSDAGAGAGAAAAAAAARRSVIKVQLEQLRQRANHLMHELHRLDEALKHRAVPW